jgi:hypothetical protein
MVVNTKWTLIESSVHPTERCFLDPWWILAEAAGFGLDRGVQSRDEFCGSIVQMSTTERPAPKPSL